MKGVKEAKGEGSEGSEGKKSAPFVVGLQKYPSAKDTSATAARRFACEFICVGVRFHGGKARMSSRNVFFVKSVRTSLWTLVRSKVRDTSSLSGGQNGRPFVV